MKTFKRGDKIVRTGRLDDSYVWTVIGLSDTHCDAYYCVTSEMTMSHLYGGAMRHATNAEIKSKCRLDSITDSVADIKYHVSPNMRVIG